MPRPLSRDLSEVGKRIDSRIADLTGVTFEQVAAAARLSPTTLYRILDGRTENPREETKRRLAKALGMAVAELFPATQLELLPVEKLRGTRQRDLIEMLIHEHLGKVPEEWRVEAIRAAMHVLVEFLLSHGLGLGEQLDERAGAMGRYQDDMEEVLADTYRRLPTKVRRSAAEQVIGAMIDVQLAAGSPPSGELYSCISQTRWHLDRIRARQSPVPRVQKR